MRCRGDPGGRSTQAGDDAAGPLRGERVAERELRRRGGQELPQGLRGHHLQPGQLHRAHLCGTDEEERLLRPQAGLRGDHAGHRPRAHLCGRGRGRGRDRDQDPGGGRARGGVDPAPAFTGHPGGRQGQALAGAGRAAHPPHPERRHRGGKRQGRRGERDALHGQGGCPVRVVPDQGAQGRARGGGVRLRRVERGARVPVVRHQGAHREGRHRGELGARGARRLRAG
mmetsp:Transcript_58263/g.131971  ORF Transcript_58263/g.131971 Transcript_58263/m.131971 type:complete len:227 (-) Transcript_58263:339-1019(-)